MAQEIEDNTFFKGQIQQLQFVSNPQAAYELCKQYIPDCTEPLPRPQQDDSMASYRGMNIRDSYDTVENTLSYHLFKSPQFLIQNAIKNQFLPNYVRHG